VTLQVVVTPDGHQIYASTFFRPNGAAWSTSKHSDEVRLCAEHALDQKLNGMVADAAFSAAIK
jgi:hypothetical protein